MLLSAPAAADADAVAVDAPVGPAIAAPRPVAEAKAEDDEGTAMAALLTTAMGPANCCC